MNTLFTKLALVVVVLIITITLPLQVVLGQVLGYTEYLQIKSSAGQLSSQITASNYQIRKIAISGSINAKDFRFIKTNLKDIEDIDLSEALIEEYIGSEGTNEGYNYQYPANEIPLGAFFYWVPVDDGMHSIKMVKLPKTITAIRRNAFARNYNLKSIDIPEGVTQVDYVAFAVDTSLISINFPSTLKSIGALAFHNCTNLESVTSAAKTPPELSSDAFESTGTNRKPYSATLYVPLGTKAQYLNSNWKSFKNIIEKDLQTTTTDIPKDGLIAYYPFNGNANDESGLGLHGQVNGAILTTDRFGKSNAAYSFNTNQDITIPNTQNKNLYPLTISLWYNVDSIANGTNGNLFSKYIPAAWNGFIINTVGGTSDGNIMWPWYIRDSSNRVLGLYGEEPFHQPNYEINKWYHFVFTVDDSGGKIYVNGVLVGSHKWTGTPGASSNNFLWKIGGLYNGWFHGKIDDLIIYNRCLTLEEIQTLYGTSTCNTIPPVGSPSQSFIKGQQLFNLSISGENIKWYTNNLGGSPISEDTFLTDGSTYYASQTLNGCESQDRLAVKVTISQEVGRRISFADQTVKVGNNIEVVISTNELSATDKIISYQFNFNFDSQKLKYLSQSASGTIGEGGNVLINNSTPGLLKISFMSQKELIGSGALLKLNFEVLSSGYISPTITGFLYNSESITNISNGIINAVSRFGDIDNNSMVQAFDAALALQYSAGFDPMPQIDPVPWESWRFMIGNVDGIGDITAYDAALILQYSVGLITVFPVEGQKKAASIANNEVIITIKDNELYFSTTGYLLGLNLSCTKCNDLLGQPVILNSDVVSAINISGDTYKIGLASINPIKENQPFMKIPIIKNGTITFDLLVNSETKSITLVTNPTSIKNIDENKNEFKLFPNPTSGILRIERLRADQENRISVYSANGILIKTMTSNSAIEEIDLSSQSSGLYLLNINGESFKIVKK